MAKSKLILNADEVRQELSCEADSLTDNEANQLSQFASDYIKDLTNKDWGNSDIQAKQCAKEIVYQTYFRTNDRQSVIVMLLTHLQDKVAMEDSSNESA